MAPAPAEAVQTHSRLFAVPGGSGMWLPPGPPLRTPTELSDPLGWVVLVYNHGSNPENRPDDCEPLGLPGTTPRVMKDLSGQTVGGRTIAVFAFCTRTRLGSFSNLGGGTPKIDGRIADIAALTAALRRDGLPAEHLFLVGHSAGGWSSLDVTARMPQDVNGAIAFAPAFAGPRSGRAQAWWDLRTRKADLLAKAPRLDALVYAVDGDPYNRPQDLQFLAGIPGVELQALPSLAIEGISCGAVGPHRVVFVSCFADTHADDLLAWLERELGPVPAGTGLDSAPAVPSPWGQVPDSGQEPVVQ